MAAFSRFQTDDYLNILPITVSSQCAREATDTHFHKNVQICYVISGSLTHSMNGETITQSSGSFFFIPPYVSHSTDLISSEETPIVVFITFRPSFLTELGYDFFPYCGEAASFAGFHIPYFTKFSGEKLQEVTASIRSIIAEFDKHENMSFERIGKLLADAIRHICTTPVKKPSISLFRERVANINKAVDYIISNHAENLSICDFLNDATMCRTLFIKYFKQVTGYSFLEFVHIIRISSALSLLRFTTLSLNEIATLSGLTDKVGFSHLFKRFFNTSPMQYRKEYQKLLQNTPQLTIPPARRFAWVEHLKKNTEKKARRL